MTKEEMAAWITATEARIAALEHVISGLERTFTASPEGTESRYERDLVSVYGERVNKKTASEILGVTRATVYAMLTNGRIAGACGGKMVSVRSLARYMEAPFTGTKKYKRRNPDEDPQPGD